MSFETPLTAAQLIAILQTVPPTTEVWYQDENFGGRGEPFERSCIKVREAEVLIHSILWEPVD